MEFDLKILYYTAFLKANFIMFILEKNTIQECVNQKFRFFLFAFFFNFGLEKGRGVIIYLNGLILCL